MSASEFIPERRRSEPSGVPEPAGFRPVLKVSDLPLEGFKPVDVQGRPLLIGRLHNQLFAWVDRCPHAGAPLRLGRRQGEELTCARHGWVFNLLTGESVPENNPDFALTPVPVKIEGDQVLVAV